ncbi:MAG: right-handed parallel beta-helix repeat-containing protein [Verrucomicrobiales bacterium]|nr:right-handed parallel beta-helix repeat-containing protein [Verrucomicrobiales bacterium]
MHSSHITRKSTERLSNSHSWHHRLIGSLAVLYALFSSLTTAHCETLVSCTGTPGDAYDRGFYIPSYPGNTLDTARLELSSFNLGNYKVTLTARRNTYDGTILGTSTVSFSLTTIYPSAKSITFPFPSPRIAKGSRVCFILTLEESPSGSLYYSVPGTSGGCTSVVQTDGTRPPLDTFRRNGVNLVITGQDTLIVAPGESIQSAIDAAAVGDTVHVDAGTFTENIHLRSGVNVVGSGFNSTTLRGLGDGTVVTAIGVTNSRFEGFRITRSGTTGDSGVLISGGSLLLDNNWITGNLDGVRIQSRSSSIIRNNIIQGNGSATDSIVNYGIISLNSTPLIANNLVISNSGVGIYLAWPDSAGTQVINNTVSGNTDSGIWCYNGANAIIKNNIFRANVSGISATHGAVPQISFNDVVDNTWKNYDSQVGGIANPGPGDISVDPLFDEASSPPFALGIGSHCINAGDPNPIYNDRDGTRNDIGCFGGPSASLGGLGSPLSTGFLFSNIGKIPTSEITQSGASIGLANVRSSVASALSIYPYKDAPLGGNLWLHGLFGSSDTAIRYYRIYAAKWTGNTPPAAADFQPITDPLSKIRYTINPSGTVTSTLESIGPDANGLYRRTDSGYWSHSDLMMIWNTYALPDGRYDILCKGYLLFLGNPVELTLPENALTRITVTINNQPVTAKINRLLNNSGVEIPACGFVPLATDRENLKFDITASHPSGFLRDFTLEALYGRNGYGGVIAHDHYAGLHDSAPPTWGGVTGVISNSAPSHASGALVPWTSCAYQFRLTAWARTTDGFNHLYYAQYNDHYSLNVRSLIPTHCVADLDGDGDVDGADLAIFAAQYGRTNCLSAPVQ